MSLGQGGELPLAVRGSLGIGTFLLHHAGLSRTLL
jgi:hypothetical protein